MYTTKEPETPLSSGRRSSGLAEALSGEIEAGRIAPGGFMPSERELSRGHGVAKKTARNALKILERKGLIAAEPRQGYRVLARANDPLKGFPVAFVMSPTEGARVPVHDFQQMLLAEFQAAATRRGWSLLVVGGHERTYGEIMEQLESGRIWGVVLNTAETELQRLVERTRIPVVLTEIWSESADLDSIVQDGFRGGYLAASHLVERGHRRIGWLGLDIQKGNPLVIDRYCGAIGGLARAGMGFCAEEKATNDAAAMEAAAHGLLSGAERPTAILALWQTAAKGLARAARKLGLTVGRDFEMVGWGNEETYETSHRDLFEPGLVPPAVIWRLSSMAETALARLEERRTNPELPAIHLRIPTRLVLGDEA